MNRVLIRLVWDDWAGEWMFRIGTLGVSLDPDVTNDLPRGKPDQELVIWDDCTYAVYAMHEGHGVPVVNITPLKTGSI